MIDRQGAGVAERGPKDIPIIFSGPMVRALLDGRKTMTRRLSTSPLRNASVGDRLWVRESLGQIEATSGTREAFYAADGEDVVDEHGFNLVPWWKGAGGLPSIHMPRRVSRLTLVVTATKVEPLQDISAADAKAEGCELFVPGHGWITKDDLAEGYSNYLDARAGFEDIWRTLHGAESWMANPQVVAISSRVVKANIDSLEAA
jgi:hypothetical protein